MTKIGAVKTLNAKNGYKATTAAQFLEVGGKYEYYISMACSDADKGKSVHYSVAVTNDTVFFDSADKDLINGYVYDKKNLNAKLDEFRTNDITASGKTEVFLDNNEIRQDGYSNFVGYNDKADYAKFSMAAVGDVTFTISTTGAGAFAIYRNNEAKKKLEVLGKVEIKKTSGELKVTGLAAGDYFISMTAKNTKANDKGSVFYNVWADATFSEVVNDGLSNLAMPETSDALAMTDSLSLGQYTDADALADASALAEFDGKSVLNALLA